MSTPRSLLVTFLLAAALAAAVVIGLSASPAMTASAEASAAGRTAAAPRMFDGAETAKITAGVFVALLGAGLVAAAFVPAPRPRRVRVDGTRDDA